MPLPSRPAGGLPDPDAVPRVWLGEYPPGVPRTYRFPRVPLWRFLDDAARDFPTVPATWYQGATIGYGQLATEVARFAAGLTGHGVQRGDRVVVGGADLPGLVIACLAALRLGAVVELVGPGPAAERPGGDRGLAAAVVGDRSVLRSVPEAGVRIRLRARDWLTPGRRALITARRWWRDRRQPGVPFPALLGTGRAVPDAEVDLDAPAVVLHGSDGPVTHSHASLVAAAFQARLWVPDVQAGAERLLLAGPLTAPLGFVGLLAGLLSAATLALPAGRTPDAVRSAARRTRPGLCVARPALVEAVASAAGGFASLRVALVDGPVPDDVRRRFEVLAAVRLRRVYAPATAPFALAAPVYGRSGPEGAMLPVTGTVATVVDDHGAPLPDGRPGRLALHGPQSSPDRVDARGWLLTDLRAVRTRSGHVVPVDADALSRSAGGAA